MFDLLDDRMMSRISCEFLRLRGRRTREKSSQETSPAARPATAKAEKRKPLDSHFKKDESGRIRVEDSDDSDSDAAAGPSTAGPSRGAGMGAYVEAMDGEDGHSRDAKGRIRFNKTQGKRSRDRVDDDNDGEVDVPVTEGLKELEIKKRFKKQKKETVHVGNEFKAKVGVRSASVGPETLPLTLRRKSCSALEATSRRTECSRTRSCRSSKSPAKSRTKRDRNSASPVSSAQAGASEGVFGWLRAHSCIITAFHFPSLRWSLFSGSGSLGRSYAAIFPNDDSGLMSGFHPFLPSMSLAWARKSLFGRSAVRRLEGCKAHRHDSLSVLEKVPRVVFALRHRLTRHDDVLLVLLPRELTARCVGTVGVTLVPPIERRARLGAPVQARRVFILWVGEPEGVEIFGAEADGEVEGDVGREAVSSGGRAARRPTAGRSAEADHGPDCFGQSRRDRIRVVRPGPVTIGVEVRQEEGHCDVRGSRSIRVTKAGGVASKGWSRLTEVLRVGGALDDLPSFGRNKGQELRQGVEEACLRGVQNSVTFIPKT